MSEANNTIPPELAGSGPDFDAAVKTRIALLIEGGSLIAAAKMQAEKAETADRDEKRAEWEKKQAADKAAKAAKKGDK